MVDLFLFQAGGADLFLRGTAAPDFVATELHSPAGGVLTLSVPLTIPAQFLKAIGGNFHLQAGTTGVAVHLSGQLSHAGAGSFAFFGLPLDTARQLVGEITLNLPVGPAAPGSEPFCLVEVTGSAQVRTVAAGGVVFAGAAFTVGVVIDELPAVPNVLPIPTLRFPEIGLHWPSIRLPWPDPAALSFPFPTVGQPLRLPVPSLSFLKFLADSPIQISWQSALVTTDPSGVVALEITNSQIKGPYGVIAGKLHLQFDPNGALNVGQSFFDLQQPVSAHLPFAQWQFAGGALALQWNGPSLAGLVRVLLPDVDDFQFENPVTPTDHPPQVTLRVLSDAQGVSELRLDWLRKANGNVVDDAIELPGFRLESKSAPMWSLLSRRDAGRDRLAFVVTLPQNAAVAAHTAFNLNRGPTTGDAPGGPESEREVHRDKGAATPLATLTLTAQQRLSAVLVDIPFERKIGQTLFLKRLVSPLPALDFANPATLFTPSPNTLASVDAASASLALAASANFEMPFLRRTDPGNGEQTLSLKRLTDPTADFAAKRFETDFEADLTLGTNLMMTSKFSVNFLWERFAFTVEDEEGIGFKLDGLADTFTFLGFEWSFSPGEGGRILTLTTKGSNYTLKQVAGSRITASFSRATSAEEPIVFEVKNFAVGPAGVSFDATVTAAPARLNGLETRFQFTQGSLQVRDNHFTSFTIAGSGPLPPDLVGPAIADISLQFAQDASGDVQLTAGSAQLRGSKLLKCQATHFQFSIDGIGLKFVNDGGFHLYFTLTGKAKYVPAAGDTSGPLAWMGAIEIQLNECPLAGDARVLARHISFLVDLPRKVSFSLLGCFSMEIRSLGFQPSFDKFPDLPAAMQIAGQIKFVEGVGDVIDVRVDFHSLFVALPEKGSFLPRLYAKELGVKIKTGDAFELEGSVNFLDGDNVAPGIKARGFSGTGSLTIMGLPTMLANFAFLRVSRDDVTWVRAWFIYLQVGKLSLRIPVIDIYIREIGLGFGYRFTLASIAAADEIDDPKKLIKELTRLSLTQGNLAEASAWKVDLENPVGTPRWTVALRALISQTSAAAGIMDWNEAQEESLACIFIMDAVIALRSDLTFLMNVRGWIYTNYNDFLVKPGLKDNPLVSGFVLLSPAKKRFLAHFSSNHNGDFGDHPPLFAFLKKALRDSYFSATLLIEPGLFHMELGWPNMLHWVADLGPLKAEFRGGSIFRVSTTELVIGQSLSARGTLDLTAEVDLGFVGARLHAFATVAYGARYIGIIGFDDPLGRSAFYGAVGIEVQVQVSIEFWLHIDLGFFSIDFDFGLSIHLGFTALLEVGILADDFPGARGTATVTIGIMGYDLHFSIHVGLHEEAVEKALALTNPFLQIGLEAGEVEPIPGTTATPPPPPAGPPGPPAPLGAPLAAAPAAGARLVAAAGAEPPLTFVGPDYLIMVIPAADGESCHFLIVPAPPADEGRCGFLPVPPQLVPNNNASTVDFQWDMPAAESGITIEHFRPATPGGASSWQRVAAAETWHVRWEDDVAVDARGANGEQPAGTQVQHKLSDLFRYAFLPADSTKLPVGMKFEEYVPAGDPMSLPTRVKGDEDERVYNPSNGAYESAVRGAYEQFDSSPYLKGDDRSPYEKLLKTAFNNKTTAYTPDGKVPDKGTGDHHKMTYGQQVIELRSTFLRGFISEAHEVAAAAADDPASPILTAKAGKFGLLFRTKGGIPSWLQKSGDSLAGTIRQRLSPAATTPNLATPGAKLRVYNPPDLSFANNPPDFDRLTHYTSSSTVAIAWDLVWRTAPSEENAEYHLLYYHVQRQAIGDLDKAADSRRDFFVKNVSAVVRDGDSLIELGPRFKFVDHFEGETGEDIALLPPGGRTYIYTITPVDLGGKLSKRSATIVALRVSDLPPIVPTDAQLRVDYVLPAIPVASASPAVVEPTAIQLSFSAPPSADATGRPPVAAAIYNVIFRQEKVLPIGSYAQDGGVQGNRTDGLPTSNARPLRTDIKLPFLEAAVTAVAGQQRIISVPIAMLRAKGILPRGQAWQPQAWRVFVQTESAANVPSALAPVELALRFRNASPSEGKKDLFEERRPELLEWIANPLLRNFLAPEDDAAEAGLADVPMPFPMDGTPAQLFQAGGDTLKSLTFKRHPLNYRVLRFRWNQANSRSLAYPREMHAGYELYEFDADSQTWPVAPATPNVEEVLQLLRRVQEVQLLSPDDLPLRPGDNLATDLWEAWYPSATRRRWLLDQPKLFLKPAPKHSQAIYSPWFSWRDSYLVWPDDQSMPKLTDFAARLPFTDSTLKISGQTVTMSGPGKLLSFAKFQYLIVRGAGLASNNGVKRVAALNPISADGRMITFENGSFGPEPASAGALTIEPLRPQLLHFFLLKLADDLRSQGDFEITHLDGDAIIDGGALPAGKPGTAADFMAENNPQRDPYGWNVLKRMGLAFAFTIRSRKYGVPITVPEERTPITEKDIGVLLQTVLARYPVGMGGFQKHLHVEYLIQPGKSVRLDQDADKQPHPNDDLLALVQISLRPAFQQLFQYARYVVKGSRVPTDAAPPSIAVKVEPASDGILIEQSGGGSPIELKKGLPQEFTFVLPSEGFLILLVRSEGADPKVTIKGGASVPPEPFGPTDWATSLFTALTQDTWVHKDFGGKATDEGVKANWLLFQSYFARTTSLLFEATPAAAPTEVVPLFLPWLQRFFDHGGDWDQAPTVGVQGKRKTGPGAWPVAAYPRSSTPAYVTPNAVGRVTYVHLIPDQWAHAFRYLILPYGRYDELWKRLAESQSLAFDPKKVVHPPALTAPDGGVDVVLHRLRPLAAPIVLSTRRLDRAAGTEKQPAEPGLFWEVIVEKHPEQILVERNRSLVRHLEYCQIVRTLVRRFSNLGEQGRIFKVVGGGMENRIVPVENRTGHQLPPTLTAPDELNPAADSIEVLRSIALPDRMNVFGRGAFALQWEAFPFYYEHRLILAAQASRVVSPITEVTQRDFTFESPQASAVGEGVSARAGRKLRITIALNSYWDCTPQSTRDRWSIEQPEQATGNQRRWSSLADPGVVYELLVARPSNALEPQVEIAFAPEPPAPAPSATLDNVVIARQRGKLFVSKITSLVAPTGNIDPFLLVVELEPSGVPPRLQTSVAVSGVAPYAAARVTGVTFPQPNDLVLVLNGTLDASELAFLLTAGSDAAGPIPRDVSFCAAVRQLVQDAGREKPLIARACLGLEQLTEIASRAELDPSARTLTWHGFLLPGGRELIVHWQENSNFRPILDRLLAALDNTDAADISVPLTAPPTTAIPPPLTTRLAVTGTLAAGTLALVWSGKLNVTAQQFSALQTLQGSPDLGPAVRMILGQINGLSPEVTTVTIAPRDDWQPRPDLTTMPAALAAKLLLGRAQISYPGPMLRADALALRAAAPSVPDKEAIERLFKESLSAGLGGTLKIRARRSSAPAGATAEVEVSL